MVPHIRRRPVTMERSPNGLGRKGFIHKDVSKGFPEWLERVTVPKKDGDVHYPLVTDTRSLLWTMNQNTVTPHVWTSRAPALTKPDLCVFDWIRRTTIRTLRSACWGCAISSPSSSSGRG